MEKWEMLGVLIHMRGVALDMMSKHRIEQQHRIGHSDFMEAMTRWEAWNSLEDKLHAKWKRLYNETAIEMGIPYIF